MENVNGLRSDLPFGDPDAMRDATEALREAAGLAIDRAQATYERATDLWFEFQTLVAHVRATLAA